MKTKYLFVLALVIFQTNLPAQSSPWSMLIGGSGTERITGAFYYGPYQSSGFVTVGYYTSTDGDFSSVYGANDCFVRHYDENHNLLWHTQLGGSNDDVLLDVITEGNQTIAVGSSNSNDFDITGNQGDYDYLVVKFDDSGNILWQKSFGGSGEDVATSIVQTSGGFVILGYSNSTDGDILPGANKGGFDLWLIKIDTDGNLLWQKNLGGSDDDKSTKIYNEHNASNLCEFYVSAFSKSSDGDLTENAGDFDFWILSLDENANILWQKSYGGSGTEINPVMNFDAGMSLYIVGASDSTDGVVQNPHGDFDYLYLMLNDSNGDLEASINFGGSGADIPTGIITFPLLVKNVDYNPDMYIFGFSDSTDGDFTTNQGGNDAWILGLDLGGGIITSQNIGGSNDDNFLGYLSYAYSNFDANFILYGSSHSNDGDFTGANYHGAEDAWLYGTFLPYGNGVNEEKLISVHAYPNPADASIWIENKDILEVSLIDETGKEVLHRYMESEVSMYRLDVSSFNPGNYILKIRTKKATGIKKILIK